MANHIVTPRTYFTVYFILLGCTALTVFLAMRAHLGALEIPTALAIATFKTLLVGWYFMHLKFSDKLIWMIVAAGVLFLAIMIGLTLTDYATRTWIPVRGWVPGRGGALLLPF